MSIAAYYQCYKQPNAFKHCLHEFRKHYPTAELWIVNDGGDPNLETIAKPYNPSHYEYQNNIADLGKQTIYGSRKSFDIWLNRLREFLSNTKADFFILLEDDVFVMKQTFTDMLHYDINGCNTDPRWAIEGALAEKIKQNNPRAPQPPYIGGCGGCFFRVSFFKRLFDSMETVNKELDFFGHNSQTYPSDVVLSYLTWLRGGTIDMYPGFAEQWYPNLKELLEKKSVSVLHKYREYYS